MTRKDARERRGKEKEAKAASSNLKLLRSMGLSPGPVAPAAISVTPYPKVAPHLQRQVAEESQQPKVTPDNLFSQPVTWCVTKKDCDGAWTWHETRVWSEEEWNQTIQPKFLEFARKTWGEIIQMAYGRDRKKMHHRHDISDLVGEAQERWKEIGLEEFDIVFRFRLGGAKRAWGYLVESHFFMVWWERHHKIYPLA